MHLKEKAALLQTTGLVDDLECGGVRLPDTIHRSDKSGKGDELILMPGLCVRLGLCWLQLTYTQLKIV